MAKRNYAKREAKEYTIFVELFQHIAITLIVMPCIRFFFRIKVEGQENIPDGVSFIVAPTHSTYLDPLLAYYATKRPVAFMAKKELFEKKILGTLIVWLGAFSVNREKLEMATIKTTQEIIKTKKWILSLFPQGSRDENGKISRITPGFAYFARVAKAKILPISIYNSGKIDDWYLKPFKFSRKLITVKIGKPIEYSKDLTETMRKWCDAIVALGDYKVEQSALDMIEEKKEKHENITSES